MLNRGLGGEPGTLDPQLAGDTFAYEILRDLYEGLTRSAPSGEVEPAAAESWSVDSSGRVYTFRLRDGLRWSNGDAVVAEDFARALRRAVDPATAAPTADMLRVIAGAGEILERRAAPASLGVATPDARTVVITLVRPAPFLPDLLANTIAFPIHPTSIAEGGSFSRPGVTVTNGPYTLVSTVIGSHYELRRNSNYRGVSQPTFDTVRFHPIVDEAIEYNRFRAGQIDVTSGAPINRIDELRGDPGVQLLLAPRLATFLYAFDTSEPPFAGKPGLAKALSMTIDREAITSRITRSGQQPAYSFVAPGVANYASPAYEWRDAPLEQRRAEAKRLYAAAGFASNKPLRLKLLYNDNELIERVTLAIAETWRDVLGVEVELVRQEYRIYLESRDDRAQWDVLRVGWSADYNDAATFLDSMTSASPQNFGRWHNDAYDNAMAAAAVEPDPAVRRGQLESAERVLLNEYAVLPVYYYASRRLARAGLEGAALNPLDRVYSSDIRPAASQ